MPDVRSHGEGTVYKHRGSGLWCAAVSTPTGRRVAYCRKADNTRKAAKLLLATTASAVRARRWHEAHPDPVRAREVARLLGEGFGR